MANLTNMTKEQLEARLAALEAAYDDYKARNLKLDMSRGKPGPGTARPEYGSAEHGQ